MAKIPNDKYYTPSDVAEHCVQVTREVMRKQGVTVTEWLEPSAGAGAFLPYLTGAPVKAYDILPDAEEIEQADFLQLKAEYKSGRVVIGNPPFGVHGNAMFAFIKKALCISDYTAYILPISQLNNDVKVHNGELIHSEDLGAPVFSGSHKVYCCFNIYKRSSTKKKKPEYILPNGVEIVKPRGRVLSSEEKADICSRNAGRVVRVIAWGTALGATINAGKDYCSEYMLLCKSEYLANSIMMAINKYGTQYYTLNSEHTYRGLSKNKLLQLLHDHREEIEEAANHGRA